MSAFSHFLLHRASATIFFFSFLCSSVFQVLLFFLLHDLSMESHIRILPLTVQSFPFPVFFLFASSCSTLSAFPPSMALSQPSSSRQPHSLNQRPHPPVDPPNQRLPLCPSFRNLSSVSNLQTGSSSWPAPSSRLRITALPLTCVASLGHGLQVSTQNRSSSPQTSALATPRASELSGKPSWAHRCPFRGP